METCSPGNGKIRHDRYMEVARIISQRAKERQRQSHMHIDK